MRRKPIMLAVFIALIFRLSLPLQAAEIPLNTTGGIYTVPVHVNRSITMEFLVDPGAGVVVIPVAVLNRLIQNGTVTQRDVIGVGTAELADSSMHLTARVRLRELRVGNTVVPDVTAAVSPALSQPLLGQSFLRRFAFVTFDNRRQVLILPDYASGPIAEAPVASWVAPNPAYPATGPYSGAGYAPPVYYPGHGK